jgi:hypothetical protein
MLGQPLFIVGARLACKKLVERLLFSYFRVYVRALRLPLYPAFIRTFVPRRNMSKADPQTTTETPNTDTCNGLRRHNSRNRRGNQRRHGDEEIPTVLRGFRFDTNSNVTYPCSQSVLLFHLAQVVQYDSYGR